MSGGRGELYVHVATLRPAVNLQSGRASDLVKAVIVQLRTKYKFFLYEEEIKHCNQ